MEQGKMEGSISGCGFCCGGNGIWDIFEGPKWPRYTSGVLFASRMKSQIGKEKVENIFPCRYPVYHMLSARPKETVLDNIEVVGIVNAFRLPLKVLLQRRRRTMAN